MNLQPHWRCARIHVTGVVQGVGFRPFVYRLAGEHDIAGWVRNTAADVEIHAEGRGENVAAFLDALKTKAPPLARIIRIDAHDCAAEGQPGFRIRGSTSDPTKGQLVSPDVATCPDCLREVFDPADRRYRYPFTNCTNCGPRFTIITDMPYDRPSTTMSSFTMCPECRREYDDPTDRRFHAQPNACPVCGPRLRLLDAGGREVSCADPLAETAALLRQGSIIAIKGLGGFLLACDATSASAVAKLRSRKRRPSRPFAVMVRGLDEAESHCVLSDRERELLSSTPAPIVLARSRPGSTVCEGVAPGLLFLGLQLPYTPLHHILLRDCGLPLVMTSGNLTDEPICADNDEAVARLAGIATYFLVHDRPIHSRYDDSVTMVVDDSTCVLRRARGIAPQPVELPFDLKPVLAVGPQMKNTFCLAKGRLAFVSQHIGDLDSVETLDHFEATIGLYRHLFRIEPELVAHDLHPDYASTAFARDLAGRGLSSRAVQHHHAHIASCIVENGLDERVIGIAFDGSGFGTDGRIWGGEFLLCDTASFVRAGHLEYLPLPGGDAAVMRPCRTAAGYLLHLFGEDAPARSAPLAEWLSAAEMDSIVRQVAAGLNTPLCSSMGRLFDAVAALTGVRGTIDYEGQAAIELEMQAHRCEGPAKDRYSFPLARSGDGYTVQLSDVLSAIVRDVAARVAVPIIAAAFHEAVARVALEMCRLLSNDSGLRTVALSGGVFQNRILVSRTASLLRADGFRVLLHRSLPANDGCVSLGQAVIAARIAA
ncbi:MAG: carbamoyltransferase HypF [Dehalococcoidia bacterium]|nr:carbamoyltransferase HypF [Dehalococcoidia bacterium]